MVNRHHLVGIDTDPGFQLDNRTVQDKLQYLYDYAANIPFDNTIISVPRSDIDITVSGYYSDSTNSIENMFDSTMDWASEESTHPNVEFVFKRPIQGIDITFRDSPYSDDITITLLDEQGRTLKVDNINSSPLRFDSVLVTGFGNLRSFEYQADFASINNVTKVRIERNLSSASYLCVAKVAFSAYTTTWADVLFNDLSVAELAERYQNPSFSKGELAPHQAFLFAFLKMLETPQALMNAFPAMHRDLYYRELLGLKPREAQPSQVAVSVQLEDTVSEVMVPKGSLLLAGQDENGSDIEYRLDQDLLANKNTFSALYTDKNENGSNLETVFDKNGDPDKATWRGGTLENEYVFIGIEDLKQGDTLALFWDLNTTDKSSVQWSYLDAPKAATPSVDNWQPLDLSLVDNTNGLSRSGTWSVVWPGSERRTSERVFDTSRAWIRGCLTSESITLNGLLTNATTATLSNASQLTDTVTGQALPSESITALATDIQGVSAVVQPWQSWGGKAPETGSEFNTRVAHLLSHRERAVSYVDIISLSKDNFAYLFDVTPIPNKKVDGVGAEKQTLVLVPRAGSSKVGNFNQPILCQQKLDEVLGYLTARVSVWTVLQVVNPKYTKVELVCTVDFKMGVNPEYAKAQLTESLIQHYMPWVSDQELGPEVANKFDYYDLLAHIQQHPLVDDLQSLTLNREENSVSGLDHQVLVFDADMIIINKKNKG